MYKTCKTPEGRLALAIINQLIEDANSIGRGISIYDECGMATVNIKNEKGFSLGRQKKFLKRDLESTWVKSFCHFIGVSHFKLRNSVERALKGELRYIFLEKPHQRRKKESRMHKIKRIRRVAA